MCSRRSTLVSSSPPLHRHWPQTGRKKTTLIQVFLIDRESLAQCEAGLPAGFPERFDMRPSGFGVDIVAGHRGNAAPVVNTGGEEQQMILRVQIGRRLDV